MSKDSTVRQRLKSSTRPTIPPSASTSFSHGRQSYSDLPLSTWHLFALLSLMIGVLLAVVVVEKQLPQGLRTADEVTHPDRFIAERAYNILKRLTSLGSRVAGSYANEVLAVNLLKDEIATIINNAKEHNIIELDVQRAKGAFPLKFLDGMTNVYSNLQNVVVKVGSKIRSPHSLLVNCHFDTVADSPGGSDDGAGCAIMLEMLRVISQSDKILRHNIVFLFNGAEENFMPASHGFITQHKWAKEIRAFINLEACGAGGREVLFQAGPNHPWILETYAEEVPYPYASSLAQEIFQSGVIPGDTDYRIFRDFGNISGLDFAWSANGYVYHTKFDTIDQIPLGTLQRTGDNILALARGMAQGHQLAEVERHAAGNLVFFDFLGAFVVRWPMLVGDIINLTTVILSIYCIRDNMKSTCHNYLISSERYWKKLLQSVGGILLTACVSILAALLIAAMLTTLGRTMSWFARPFWMFFLYVVPTTLVAFACIYFHADSIHKDVSSPWTVFKLYYDAYQAFWTLMLFVGLLLRIRSSFIPLYWVLFASLGTIISKVFKHWKDGRWLLLHIAVMALPFVQSVYLFLSALYLFVPIMGRAGAGNNSELMIAGLVSSLYVFIISFVIPLILLIRSVERVFSSLLGLFLLSVAVLIFTPLGFPYSGETNWLAPQRFMISHTSRVIHEYGGAVATSNPGFWIVDMDVNSPHTVDRYVPEMREATLVDADCERYLYCGLPYLVAAQTFIWKTHFISGPAPTLSTPGTLKILAREKISDGENVTVEVGGPSNIGVMISPILGVELTSWSLVATPPLSGPLWNGRSTYFVFYSYAGNHQPLVFSMIFKVPVPHSGPIMDIAVTTHYLFGDAKTSPLLQNLVDQFPSWAAVTYWTSSYELWIV